MSSQYADGGFEARFEVRRTSGKPCDPRARYFVLNLGLDDRGNPLDPHAHVAAMNYADSVAAENTQLSDDLKRMLGPAGWPADLAQHADAE